MREFEQTKDIECPECGEIQKDGIYDFIDNDDQKGKIYVFCDNCEGEIRVEFESRLFIRTT